MQELDAVTVRGDAAQSSVAVNRNVEVLRHEELVKFGQVTLGEAMSRSGTIVVISGRNGNPELTLSGLGDGYTQVLLNGSKAPRGFSLDSLSTEAVERVEIIRSPGANSSARGVAGTINIVLRRAAIGKRATTVKLSGSGGWIRGYAADGSYSTDNEAAGIFLQASDRRTHVERKSTSMRQTVLGEDVLSSTATVIGPATVHETTFTSKVEMKESSRSLILDSILQSSRQSRMSRTEELAMSPVQLLEGATTHAVIRRETYTGTVTFRDLALAETVSAEAALTATKNKRTSEGQVIYDELDNIPTRLVTYPSTENSASLKGKLGFQLSDAEIEVGAQLDKSRRAERDILIETERQESLFNTNVMDAAVYGRWIGKIANADIQAGLRMERLTIGYRDDTSQEVTRRFDVFAPQLSWSKIIDNQLPALNIALSRSVRIPDENQFSTRIYYSNFNSRFQPDLQGNPSLRPEIATSLEFSLTPSKSAKNNVTGSLVIKSLEHVISDELLQNGETWVARPTNIGRGSVVLIDVNYRHGEVLDIFRIFDLTYGAKLNGTYSRVVLPNGQTSAIPNSVPYQATLSIDMQKQGDRSWSTGFNFVYRASQSYYRINGGEVSQGPRRLLDIYFSRSVKKGLTGRLSISNIIQESRSESYYQRAGSDLYREITKLRDGPTIKVALEWVL